MLYSIFYSEKPPGGRSLCTGRKRGGRCLMNDHSVSFSALVIIATAAFFTPIVVSRIKAVRIPVVVGELLVGIAIGRSGFDIVRPEPWLDFLSTLGITYLMFLSGVEIDFKLLRK